MALYHSARGSVGYTIVGTPTIVDGVAKDFSLDNYLSLNSTITSFKELSISFIPGTYSSGRIVLFKTGVNAYRGALNWASNSTARFGYTNTNNDGGNLTNIPYTEGKENILKIEYVSTNSVKLTLSRQGESDFIRTITDIDIPATFGGDIYLGRGTSGYSAFNGSIDLNKTYFIDNGQPFFGICPIEVKKHQLKGPVGYTVTGSPTITDGVLSGTSSSNYCSVNVNVPSFNTLEVIMRAKFTGTINSSAYMPLLAFGGGVSQRRITNNFTTASDGGTRLFSSDGVIVNIPNTDFDLNTYAPDFYYTRLRVTKNTEDYTYELGVSADGTRWITKSANYASNICSGYFYLCRNSSGSAQGDVYCDLNNTYIKVNGKLWFWQPRETEKIVVNGVQVWQKPS